MPGKHCQKYISHHYSVFTCVCVCVCMNVFWVYIYTPCIYMSQDNIFTVDGDVLHFSFHSILHDTNNLLYLCFEKHCLCSAFQSRGNTQPQRFLCLSNRSRPLITGYDIPTYAMVSLLVLIQSQNVPNASNIYLLDTVYWI